MNPMKMSCTVSRVVGVLSNLTPETVAAIEGVNLDDRLQALPGVEEVRRQGVCNVHFDTEVEMLASDGESAPEEFCVREASGIKPDTEAVIVVLANHVVYGGLSYDQEWPSDVMEGGRLYHRNDRDERREYLRATCCTDSGDPDVELEAIAPYLAKLVWEEIRQDKGLVARLNALKRSAGKKGRLVEIFEEAARYGKRWADYLAEFLAGQFDANRLEGSAAGIIEALAERFEWHAESAWEQAYSAGDLLEPGVVEVETSRGTAVWVPEKSMLQELQAEALQSLMGLKLKWFEPQKEVLPPCPSTKLSKLMLGTPAAPPARVVPGHHAYSFDGKDWAGGFLTRDKALNAALATQQKISMGQINRAITQHAKRYAEGFTKIFDACVNGEIYGVQVAVCDRTTGEPLHAEETSYWGVIGSEYAQTELDDAVLQTVMCLSLQH